MTSTWQIMAGNLAVVALFVLGWAHVRYWLSHMPRPQRQVIFGVTMGSGCIASMIMAVPFSDGIYFDLRSSLLLLAAFFGGLPTALLSMAIAVSYRVVVGGLGVYSGIFCIVLSSLVGLALSLSVRRFRYTLAHVLILGIAASLVTFASMLTLPRTILAEAMANMAGVTMTVNFLATSLAALLYLQTRRLAADRDLMGTALANAPDYAYVKDRHGLYAAVNIATARLNGFAARESMLGKSDFDFAPPERAQAQFTLEQQVLSSSRPILGAEEQVTDPDGTTRWFTSSTVPLHNRQGEIIGLAGVKRDITVERNLQTQLRENRDALSLALAEMSDGLAMFDGDGFLVFCNEQYRQSFPRTGAMRLPGVHYRQMLEAVLQTGERLNVPEEGFDAWSATHCTQLNRESEYEINLFDGRWLLVRTRPASNGATLVVVSDITRSKQSELELHSTANQLKALALIDGLTGLLNRRAFDDEMEKEVRRSSRTAAPLSLLLIDVDRFKLFNDRYGHPAGDGALRAVSDILKSSLKRPADLAMRYGGEEFAAILPETDEDGAYLVAEAFRKALAEAGIVHAGSERGHLTASVGVATYMPDNVSRSVSELVKVADEALYGAKAAGRDRVFGMRVPAPTWHHSNPANQLH